MIPEACCRRRRSPSLRQHRRKTRENLVKHAAENQRDGDFLGADLVARIKGRHAVEGRDTSAKSCRGP